jgi:MFS family permease
MTPHLTGITKNKGFYGWIALSGAVFSLLMSGTYGNSFGVFLPVIANEFGWSRATVAAAFSLAMLAIGLPSPLWGLMAARFGPRINIILGNTLVAVVMACLYFLHDFWYLYLLFIFIGLGAGLGGNIQTTIIATNWFTEKISLAQGIAGTASGLAGFIFPPLTIILIAAVDWRLSWVILGGMTLMGGVVIGGIILVRNRPEDMGQVPDGIKTESIEDNVRVRTYPEKGERPIGSQITKLLKMPITWLIFIFIMANSIVMGTMIPHQVAYMQDIGFTPMIAATSMSILSVANIFGSLTFGVLALRISIRYLGASAFILHLAGLIILLTSKELGWLYIYSALVGTGYGALLAAIPTFIGTYYGRKTYPQLIGFAMAIHLAANAVAGTIAGLIYDIRGSYTLAFIIVAVFIVIGLVSISLARKPLPIS